MTSEDEAARAAALSGLYENIPYMRLLGVRFERMGDELTAVMPFKPDLIGNPLIPALHGGATGAFLEISAIMQLAWLRTLDWLEEGGDAAARVARGEYPPLPKTADISIDYLRSGKPRDAFARALVRRMGRRVANVRVEAWQLEREKPIAAAHGHFLLPDERR